MDKQEHPEIHRESSDVNVGAIFAFAAGLIVAAVIINGLVWLLFVVFASGAATRNVRQYPLAITEEARLPPEPRLQTTPRQDLLDLRAQEDAVLNQYEWVDKNAGIVRIPVSEAMRLVVQRGLPVQPARPSIEQRKR
jgi:hypothetical protein